jgi:hypothetical protein
MTLLLTRLTDLRSLIRTGHRALRVVAILASFSAISMHGQGKSIVVPSIAALQSAIDRASPGDTIVLANGTYVDGSLLIGMSKIVVRAATPGSVFLNGRQHIAITGDDVTFSGFQFTSGDVDSADVIQVSGSYVRLTQLNFNGYRARTYINIMTGSQYNEISYCNIENKPTAAVSGCTIQIHISPTIIGYHKVRFCSFQNFPGPGGDFGNEPLRVGLSTEIKNISRTVVEYCYFENVGLGDNETISLKSSENVCRYNTFTNNPKGMLVFRRGYRNTAYGNFFINGSGGIRIKGGEEHFVHNNLFETGSADALVLNFVPEDPIAKLTFVHNTFVNGGEIDLGGEGPLAVHFANNIFVQGSQEMFRRPNGGTTWAGNIYEGKTGLTIASGMTMANPLLVKNSDGSYGLASGSPAIDASSSDYPALPDIEGIDDDPSVQFDIVGRPRPASKTLKDVGCVEHTVGKSTNHPLTLSEVGPSYLGGSGSK